MNPLPLFPPAGSIPSPFAPDGFIVQLERAAAHRERMQRGIAQDIDVLRMPSANRAPCIAASKLADYARAYRIFVRCAVISATHLYDFHDVHLKIALRQIRELPDGAEGGSAEVMQFIDRLIWTTGGAPNDATIIVCEHFAKAIEKLVQSHLPVVRQTAVFWETHRRVEDKRKNMLRKMREIRRISQNSI